MNTRHETLFAGLLTFAGLLAAFPVQALTLHELKGQDLDNIYGTYAPGGHCQREPRVTADDSGLTYDYRGARTHPKTFEYAVGFFSGGHSQVSPENAAKRVILPFGTNDPANMQMTFDTQRHSLVIKAYPARGKHLSGLKAALVRGSPYARCAVHAVSRSLPNGTPSGIFTRTQGFSLMAHARWNTTLAERHQTIQPTRGGIHQ